MTEPCDPHAPAEAHESLAGEPVDDDGYVGFDAELREAVGRLMAPCGEVNNIFGFRCDRAAGHDGAHIQQVPNGVNAWGFDTTSD